MNKKAIITTGGNQYLVAKDDEIETELLANNDKKKKISFEPLLLIEDKNIKVGKPFVQNAKVNAEIIGESRGEKSLSIRYKAKKRIRKVKGHKQNYSKLKITSIE